ncbi:ArsR/SmtB family transcription factor [Actibacterium ureilyticum]|uniref:ArsR/SmtB family transcription factor n=1 Tax=Actibacterium ureilyticum TaxID=1590614 RepID=UPI000BAB1FA9|nr:helix-turn-helix transcriptional regulator [Actibacterium ureilyticum]
MRHGPDITRIAALIGEPARANMLQALMGGQALSAGELAVEGGVSPATTSGHLRQMAEAGLIVPRQQGRHRYYTLAGPEIAQVLETLIGLAEAQGHRRTRPGPRDAALRRARVCYDHLAGAVGVQVFQSMTGRGFLHLSGDTVAPTDAGVVFLDGLGVDLAPLRAGRRPLCRICLDWSERRNHLAGALGAALFDRMQGQGWLRRAQGSRVVDVTSAGAAALARFFPEAGR